MKERCVKLRVAPGVAELGHHRSTFRNRASGHQLRGNHASLSGTFKSQGCREFGIGSFKPTFLQETVPVGSMAKYGHGPRNFEDILAATCGGATGD